MYVTDCNGSNIRDAGMKDCDGVVGDPSYPLFYWEEAPDLYCVHVYPQTHPRRDRYYQYFKSNSCMILGGDEENWHYDQTDISNCMNSKCPN